jgi:hypothetical protein
MQRYTLGDYKSVYRDPGSVPINTQLRQQFAQAFAADDALAGAVDQMQAADFAGDQELKKQIEERTRAQLESRASKGNYESMGMDVTKSARAFAKDYQPLTQNLAKVKAYQEKIEKDYRDGFIDINTRNAKLAMSTKDYQGLQVNEQGVVDQDSFFKGKQYVEDVDISADFDKRMEGYIAEKYNKSRGGYEKVELPGGAVEYHIQTEKGLEIIDPKKVSRMFQDMIAGPKYQAAIAQQAEVGTYMFDDEAIQSKLVTALDGDPEDPDSKGLRQDLVDAKKELEDAKTKKEKAAAEQSIKALEGSISEMESALETPGKTPEEMESIRRNFIQNSYADALIGREQQAALDKFARVNVIKDNYNVKYSEKEIADYNRIQDAQYGSGIAFNMDAIQVKNPGGTTVKDIISFKDTQVTAQNQQVRAFKEAVDVLGGDFDVSGVTADDIVNGNVPEELKDLPSYKSAVKIINNAKREIKLQNQLLTQAREKVGHTNNDAISFVSRTDGAQEAIDVVKQVVPGISDIEAIGLLIDWRTGDATLAARERLGVNIDPKKSTDIMSSYRASDIYDKLNEAFGTEEVTGRLLKDATRNLSDRKFGKNNNSLNSIITSFSKFDKEGSEKVDKYLEKEANRTLSYTAQDRAPGFNKKQRYEVNKVFDSYFQGRSMSALSGMNLGYAGMGPDGTSTILGFREAMSKDKRFTADEQKAWANGEITIDNVLFNESTGVDNGGITLQVKNSEGAISQVYVPQSEFDQPELSQYFNSPLFRTSAQVNKAKNMGLKSTSIELKPAEDGTITTLEFGITTDGADNVKIISGDEVYYMGTGSKRFIDALNDFETLGLLPY